MDSSAAYRALYGVFCIYKPYGKSIGRVIYDLKTKLIKDLNCMTDRQIKQRLVYNEENVGTNLPVVTTVPDLSDHPLVIGKRFQEQDLMIGKADTTSYFTSGVSVFNINGGIGKIRKLSRSGHLKVYHAKGEFGYGTLDCTPQGKIVERTTYRHVNLEKLDRVLAGIQSAHQRYMFQLCKVDLQSQEAYELAVQGLVRPKVGKESNPMIYGIKCIDFQPPHFTLEIHCVNEQCKYLMKLIHDIGIELKTTAVCNQLRRIRYGHFTLSHALLQKQWDVQSILQSIQTCRALLTEEKLLRDGNIQEIDSLTDGTELIADHQQFLGSDKHSRLLLKGDETNSNTEIT